MGNCASVKSESPNLNKYTFLMEIIDGSFELVAKETVCALQLKHIFELAMAFY